MFDIIVVLSIGIALTMLYMLNLLDGLAKFALIPLLGFYYLGQYSERKFSVKKE